MDTTGHTSNLLTEDLADIYTVIRELELLPSDLSPGSLSWTTLHHQLYYHYQATLCGVVV